MPLILMTGAINAWLACCSAVAQAFAAFAQLAAPAAIAALWQGTVVAVALVLCLRLAPRISATHRFAAWAVGFAVVVGLLFLPVIARSLAASATANLPPEQTAERPWLYLNSRWEFIIAALWLVASCLRASELAMHSLRLRRLWKTATPIEAGGSLRSLLAAASQGRPIELCTTCELDRPSVIGFLAPRILIPEWIFFQLTPGELEQVVLHESEHLHRRDDWTNLLQKLFLVLFSLNPALAWIERRLCREREMACDEGVVRRTQAPRAYAACLTTLAEREAEQRELLQRTQALSLGAFEHRPELVHRVHTILRRRQALHPAAARALVGVVGCGLLFGSVELARCPQVVAFVAAQRPSAQAANRCRQQPDPRDWNALPMSLRANRSGSLCRLACDSGKGSSSCAPRYGRAGRPRFTAPQREAISKCDRIRICSTSPRRATRAPGESFRAGAKRGILHLRYLGTGADLAVKSRSHCRL